MVDSQLFKYTNANSILSPPTASLLATLQPLANTVGTGIIRWLKFALRQSGTNFFRGIIPLDGLLCRHCTWVYPWNRRGCFQTVFYLHSPVLTLESWRQWIILTILWGSHRLTWTRSTDLDMMISNKTRRNTWKYSKFIYCCWCEEWRAWNIQRDWDIPQFIYLGTLPTSSRCGGE